MEIAVATRSGDRRPAVAAFRRAAAAIRSLSAAQAGRIHTPAEALDDQDACGAT